MRQAPLKPAAEWRSAASAARACRAVAHSLTVLVATAEARMASALVEDLPGRQSTVPVSEPVALVTERRPVAVRALTRMPVAAALEQKRTAREPEPCSLAQAGPVWAKRVTVLTELAQMQPA
jgi:hypothetical protein